MSGRSFLREGGSRFVILRVCRTRQTCEDAPCLKLDEVRQSSRKRQRQARMSRHVISRQQRWCQVNVKNCDKAQERGGDCCIYAAVECGQEDLPRNNAFDRNDITARLPGSRAAPRVTVGGRVGGLLRAVTEQPWRGNWISQAQLARS
jgi:hypothetical protein